MVCRFYCCLHGTQPLFLYVRRMISMKRGVKHAVSDTKAMSANKAVTYKQLLKEYKAMMVTYPQELQGNLVLMLMSLQIK